MPVYPGQPLGGGTFGAQTLVDQIAKGRGLEDRGEALRSRFETVMGNTTARDQNLAATANSAVQSQFSQRFGGGARGFRNQLEQSLRRGKARQGIQNRGENAIRNQQLKDRLTLARSAINRRGTAMSGSASAMGMRQSEQNNLQAGQDAIHNAKVGAIGGVVGGLASGFSDMFGGGTLSQGVAKQQGQLDDSMGLMPLDVGGLDNGFNIENFNFDTSQTGSA
jgi:hypothetical protein